MQVYFILFNCLVLNCGNISIAVLKSTLKSLLINSVFLGSYTFSDTFWLIFLQPYFLLCIFPQLQRMQYTQFFVMFFVLSLPLQRFFCKGELFANVILMLYELQIFLILYDNLWPKGYELWWFSSTSLFLSAESCKYLMLMT